MNNKKILGIAGLFMAVAVATGAFGAHMMKDILTPARLETWNTAVLYHFLNTLGLMALALASEHYKIDLKAPAIFILAGIIIFSGSLYTLCIADISFFGMITPVGGVSFIIGWSLFATRLFKSEKS
tara:strand:- start:112442 stop:112819 length:378 start_codon:yes stop_codon:yes gene_type:complete